MSEIRPALTPEQWENWKLVERGGLMLDYLNPVVEITGEGEDYGPVVVKPEDMLFVIAVLHRAMMRNGVPLFTRVDVKRLRSKAEVTEASYFYSKDPRENSAHAAWLHSLADRIEALLPPETP